MDPIELAQSRATRCKEGGARAAQLAQSRGLLGTELRLHLVRVRVRVRVRMRVRVRVTVGARLGLGLGLELGLGLGLASTSSVDHASPDTHGGPGQG
jgi:hypothetical protein